MTTPHKAWLLAPDGTLRVASSDEGVGHGTAVCRLVAGVYAREGFASFLTLRRRIYTTAPANAFDAELVKVTAKRCVFSANFVGSELDGRAQIDVSGHLSDPVADRTVWLGGIGTRMTDEEAMRACRALADSVPLEPERFASARPIAALAVDAEGGLLGAAVNNNAINRLRHAEFNLVSNHFGAAPIPAGATIYVSLSPCRMCAALLARVAADGAGLRVVALVQDEGRHGRQGSLSVKILRSAQDDGLRSG